MLEPASAGARWGGVVLELVRDGTPSTLPMPTYSVDFRML